MPPVPPPAAPVAPPPPQPPGLVQRIWAALFPAAAEAANKESFWYQWLIAPWSLPARVAWFVACVLLGVVAGAWLNQWFNPNHVAWRFSQPLHQQLLVAILLVVIPVVVYQALRMWLQSEKSPYPDIDSAWNAGREELRRQGIELRDRPVYLILGSTGEPMERAFLEGMGGDKVFRGVPSGAGPLRWYVDSQRVFICCSDAGWMSADAKLLKLRGRGRGGLRDRSEGNDDIVVSEMGRASATIRPGAFLPTKGMSAGLLNSSDREPGMSSDSISHDDFIAMQPEVPAVARETAGETPPLEHLEPEDETPAIVPASDARLQQDRLEAVCSLLKVARFPYCPINGCVMLLPFAANHASQVEIEEIAKAVNADLTTAQGTLQIRFPVVAVFTGLEAETGFRELMRRVGPEKSKISRFGMGYDLRAPATSPELESFASHVCGVFEDWVYGLFREDQVLKRPGNSPLFALLCRIRSGFKTRLAEILSNGFGYSERIDPAQAPYFFSGCYFVATGNSPDQRAFSGGILEKLDGEQDRLEWNASAAAEDRGVGRVRRAALFATLLLALLLAAPWLLPKNSGGNEKPIDGSQTDDSERAPKGE